MSSVRDPNGLKIGELKGSLVRDINGNIIYAVLDGEVYAPVKWMDEQLQHFSRGMLALVGTMDGNKAMSMNGDDIFEIS